MKKNSLDLTQLQDKITEAQQAQDRLPQLQAEINLASKELERISIESKARTAKAIEKGKIELKEALSPLKSQLIALQEKRNKLKELVGGLDTEFASKTLAVSDLNNEILSRNADISTLDREVEEKRDILENLKTEIAAARVDFATVNQEVADLREEIAKSNSLLEFKHESMAVTESKIAEAEQAYQVKSDQYAKDQAKWDAKLLNTKQEATILRNILQKESDELAKRKLAADDRDRNLRLREKRAQIKDDIIQNNASLLEL